MLLRTVMAPKEWIKPSFYKKILDYLLYRMMVLNLA